LKAFVIIPAYNEEKRIGKLIKMLKRENPDYVIVVDDGSDDGTCEIAKKYGAIVIRNERNMGKGYSVRRALRWIEEHLAIRDEDVVVTMDADLQHNPENLWELVGKSRYYDVVIGKRDKRKYTFIKKLGNALISLIVSFMLFKSIPDCESGYKAIKWKVFKKILPFMTANRYAIEGEILILASKFRFSIGFVPVSSTYIKGKGVGVIDGIKNAIHYARVWLGLI